MTPERLTYHVGLSQITKDTLPPVYHEVVVDLVDVTADRDRIAAELATAHEEIALSRQSEGETMADLLATRAELARVRRSQLRRLDRLADQRCDELLDLDAADTQGDGFYWRWFGRMVAFRDACRAALAQPQDGTTEGQE